MSTFGWDQMTEWWDEKMGDEGQYGHYSGLAQGSAGINRTDACMRALGKHGLQVQHPWPHQVRRISGCAGHVAQCVWAWQ